MSSPRDSPGICLPVYLSVCLSASLKTQLFCDTCSIFELDNVQNEAILRDFLNFWTWQHPKRSNSAVHGGSWAGRVPVSRWRLYFGGVSVVSVVSRWCLGRVLVVSEPGEVCRVLLRGRCCGLRKFDRSLSQHTGGSIPCIRRWYCRKRQGTCWLGWVSFTLPSDNKDILPSPAPTPWTSLQALPARLRRRGLSTNRLQSQEGSPQARLPQCRQQGARTSQLDDLNGASLSCHVWKPRLHSHEI